MNLTVPGLIPHLLVRRFIANQWVKDII